MTNPRIAVVGTGYVGLTSAACLAHLGRTVTAIDIDELKIDTLRAGEIPILENGLHSLVNEGIASGRLTFTHTYEPCATADIVLLCLPTPHTDHAGPDLDYVEQAAYTLRPLLRADSIVVTKSTVPVGTHRQLATWLDRPDVHIASNPEFLREGSAVRDFLHPDRIVIGAHDEYIGERISRMYSGVDSPILITDPTSAELIKYTANSFLASKLSFINEISRLCDHLGADIEAISAGIGSDPRIGSAFLQPGPGWGGSCFPKDTRGLTHIARQNGQYLPVAEAAYASNVDHFDYITAEITRLCPIGVDRARVAVWGATFKAGTDDVRDSPAIEIINRLIAKGADVVVYDPAAPPEDVSAPVTDDLYTSCLGADMLVVLTEWPDFAAADLDKVAQLLAGSTIYDTRNVIDHDAAQRAGLALRQPGRPQ